jgi:hypothetical protein
MENLNLAHLVTVREALDIAFSRGAYKANEAKQFGELYETIDAFLKAVIAQQNQEAQESAPPEPITQGE